MKKIASFLIILAVSASCGKATDLTPNSCDNLSEEYVEKATAFSSNPSKSSCEALVKSLDNLVKKCTILTVAEKKQYQESLNSIDCSSF